MKINRTWIILGIIVLIVIIGYSSCKSTYNNLVTKDQDIKGKWAQVESQYQRRTDLYNSVIEVIKGSASFEQNTLVEVINARAKATQVTVDASKLTPESIAAFQAAQTQMSGAFGRLMVVAERYPDLKTTQQFADFQTQIEGTENRINKSRDDFNLSVQDFNTTIKRFPTMFYAGMLGFTEKGYFKSNPGTENPPDINFNTDPKPETGSTQK
ncbi:MAG: LemA family protein [Chitinophagales bacterium]|nr:LemA family protein [Chitinophagales bacterium]